MLKVFPNSIWLKSNVENRKISQTPNPIETNDMALETYENALFSHVVSFSNFEWFKSNLENGTSSTKFVFSIFFLIIRPNIANDMALESLKKCKTFWYILFLQIHYGFTLILKMTKNVFSS